MNTQYLRAGITAVLVWFALASSSVHAASLEPALNEALQGEGDVAFIVQFSDRLDLQSLPANGKGRGIPLAELIISLQRQADSSQQNAVNLLKKGNARRIIQLWSINALAATAKPEVVQELAALPEVEAIKLDATFNAPSPEPAASTIPEWNIDAVNVPALWSEGLTGLGTVVAAMDTGADVQHPDLADNWRGGTNSWYDPNGEHATPYDAGGHGTQSLSVAVGGDAGGSAIGVAPGAQWIAVKIFNDAGVASLSGIHQGFQWLLDPDGDPMTLDAPDVVNNSWGFPSTAGECYTEFSQDIEVLKAAGIAVVFAAGNEGQNGSASPADNPEAFAVGAVDSSNNVASFSSRGPSA
ncbi:MAG: S8 family serine peptidase, partial [Pseudomonadota bacterium]